MLDDLKTIMNPIDLVRSKELLESGNPYPFKKIENSGKILYEACKEKMEKTALELMDLGADYRYVNEFGNSIFAIACSNELINVAEKILSITDEYFEKENSYGATPWIATVIDENIPMLEYLRKKGVNIHSTDSNLTNVLHHASLFGSAEIVEYLINIGIDFNHCDRANNTPVQYAFQFENMNALKVYMNHYNELSDKDKELMKKVRLRLLFV